MNGQIPKELMDIWYNEWTDTQRMDGIQNRQIPTEIWTHTKTGREKVDKEIKWVWFTWCRWMFAVIKNKYIS